MKTYKLMIKIHSVTGMQYLCITCKKNWVNYHGSGIKWKRHINKYGYDISTVLLYESENYDNEFIEKCKFYSNLFDVTDNKNFANLIPEVGYDSGKDNFDSYWNKIDDTLKKEIYKRRGNSLKNNGNHWVHHEDMKKHTLKKIALALSKYNPKSINYAATPEQHQKMLRHMKFLSIKSQEFFKNKDTEKYKKYVVKQSIASIQKFKNMTSEERKLYGNKISEGRLSMSEEAKRLRGVRVGEAFKTSEKRKQFNADMKIKRIGLDNPNCKAVMWFGEEMTKMEFDALKIEENYAKNMFETREDCIAPPPPKEYEPITCPYCDKNSGNKKHSSFKRWHFENCKGKTNEKSN